MSKDTYEVLENKLTAAKLALQAYGFTNTHGMWVKPGIESFETNLVNDITEAIGKSMPDHFWSGDDTIDDARLFHITTSVAKVLPLQLAIIRELNADVREKISEVLSDLHSTSYNHGHNDAMWGVNDNDIDEENLKHVTDHMIQAITENN